jgi:hypothetical protein
MREVYTMNEIEGFPYNKEFANDASTYKYMQNIGNHESEGCF